MQENEITKEVPDRCLGKFCKDYEVILPSKKRGKIIRFRTWNNKRQGKVQAADVEFIIIMSGKPSRIIVCRPLTSLKRTKTAVKRDEEECDNE